MSFLKSLENKLERLFEGSFKSAFKSTVQPVELARRLAREMDSSRTASVSRTYVPNEYTVFLSPEDHGHFAGYEDGLRRELSTHLLEHARKRGYSLTSRPTVDLRVEDRLELGQFGIQARLVDAPADAPVKAAAAHGHTMIYSVGDLESAATGNALLIYGDRRYVLSGPKMVLGRGKGSDIRVDDPNISRHHAELRLEQGSWSVVDLGSTNGTRVDGRPVSGVVPLQAGDRLQLGNTTVTFQIE